MAKTLKTANIEEWVNLGTRLVVISPAKFEELLEALRKIVDAQELIASFDWQLAFRGRPQKRYLA